MQENDLPNSVPAGGAGDARQGEGEPQRGFYPERRSLDRMLVPFSVRCLNAPLDQLDREIEKGLKEVHSFFGGDRVLLWEFSEDGQQAHLTHSHAEAGAELPAGSLLHETLPYIFDRVRGLENLCVSQPEDLPQAARMDKQYLERSGIRSFMVIPLLVGGILRGALSLACIGTERAWSNKDLFDIERIGTVLASVLDRKRSHQMLERRMCFEKLLADLSPRFINPPLSEVDREIEQALARVLDFFRADRGGLLGVSPEGKFLWATHASYGDGIERVSGDINLAALFPWSYEKLVIQGNYVNVTRMAELPPEAETDRRSWTAMGVRSSLTVPLFVEGRVSSLIVINAMRGELSWPEEYVPRLRLLGEIFINALEHRRKESMLRTSEDKFRQFFSHTPEYCYIISPTGTILEANHFALDALGYEREELIGQPLAMIYAPECLPKMKEVFDRWKKDGEINNEEMVILAKNGEKRVVLLNVGAVRGENGAVLHSTSVQTDITERKRMEEQLQERLREIEALKQQLEKENIQLREEIKLQYVHEEIVGRSEAMKRVLNQVEQVARTDSTALIQGETGTGKELLARAIHQLSGRKDRPLVTVNCASLPPSLIESELFGRERGAYTGALTRMVGRFEAADGSALFLDEIGELPQDVQSKLLRVLEEGRFERLGSTKTLQVNVRIIAATNRDLAQDVKEGRFRKDLYYRLNVFPIAVPPLRERPEDIPPLVWSFVRQFEKKMGKRVYHIPRRCMEALQSYSWPGNARELRNVIERAMIVSSGTTLDVAIPVFSPAETMEAPNLRDVERRHILKVLEKTGWHITGEGGAAEILGLKRTTLQSKMKKLGVKGPPA